MPPLDLNLPPRPEERAVPFGFKLIGTYKLATAALSLALAFGMFGLLRGDVAAAAGSLIRGLRLDPHNRIIHLVLEAVSRVDRRRLEWIEAGTVAYALLHLVEGIGILKGRRWGGVLIILATSSLIPIEFYEILQRPTVLRIAASCLNTTIVIYLVRNRRILHRGVGSTRMDAGPEVPWS